MIKEIVAAVTDKYDRHARLYPSLLTFLPVSILVLAITPDLPGLSKLGGLVVASGVSVVALNLSRERGRILQPKLYARWGGTPTTLLLRYRGSANRQLTDRRHRLLQELVGTEPQLPMDPSAERQAPKRADSAYEIGVGVLKERTRDKSRYALVFAELCNYGFRRNMLGLRPIGISFSLACALVAGAPLYLGLGNAGTLWASLALDLIALGYWWICVTDRWVKNAAFVYAETLLAALDR